MELANLEPKEGPVRKDCCLGMWALVAPRLMLISIEFAWLYKVNERQSQDLKNASR